MSARVGVRFDKVPRNVQAQLDRFVFALMRKKARARARDTHPGAERRMAPRVEMGTAEELDVELLPARLGALSRSSRPAGANPRFRVLDISTTGMAFQADELQQFLPRKEIRLRLVGEGIDLELPARVMNVVGGG